MKNASIEVLTTQNVTIKYEFAEIIQRIGAYILDLVFMNIIALVPFITVSIISSNVTTAYYLFFMPILIFYTLVLELFNNGQTLGKQILGIKVIRIDGSEPETMDYVVRWIFSPADYMLTFGIMATVLIKISKNHQRLGDIVGGTSVIRIKPSHKLTLSNLLSIGDNYKNYVVKYPEVRRYSEEQVILIKTTLDRYVKTPNIAHTRALLKLVRKVTVNIIPEKELKTNNMRVEFLKTVISDYVILTR
ncbi:MAG: RDD family protein [Bacteroidota bacterium]